MTRFPHQRRLGRRFPTARALFVAFVLLSCDGTPLAAAADPLSVSDPWVRLPPPGANAAAYMSLNNEGATPILITGVRGADIERVELHRSFEQDGVARMERVDSLKVPAQGGVELAPRGLHVMLIRPGNLIEGQLVELELTFEDGAVQRVSVPVLREAPRSSGSD